MSHPAWAEGLLDTQQCAKKRLILNRIIRIELDRNTWKHLTVYQQMLRYKPHFYVIYTYIYMCVSVRVRVHVCVCVCVCFMNVYVCVCALWIYMYTLYIHMYMLYIYIYIYALYIIHAYVCVCVCVCFMNEKIDIWGLVEKNSKVVWKVLILTWKEEHGWTFLMWYYSIYRWGGDKGNNTFPSGISQKMKVIVWLEFELAYYNLAFQNISHYAMRTLLAEKCMPSEICRRMRDVYGEEYFSQKLFIDELETNWLFSKEKKFVMPKVF